MNTPPKPTGTDQEARWHQWVHDSLVMLTNMKIKGGKMEKNSSGLNIIVDPPKGETTTSDAPVWL